MATKTVLLTTGTTWTVPDDLNKTVNVTVVCIGGGGGGRRQVNSAISGAGGGGGGAWATSSISLSGITTAYYNIGGGGNGGTTSGSNGGTGGDTWFNKSTNAAPTVASNGALAKGGSGSTGSAGGSGGSATSSIGDTDFSGGNGGNGGTGGQGRGGGGGGSAGKDTATGRSGGAGASVADGGGGGGGGVGGNGTSATTLTGANGGLTYSGAAGGTGGTAPSAGIDGGGGGGGSGRNTAGATAYAGAAGGAGTEQNITAGGTAGSGGGGGGGGGTDNSSAIGGVGGDGALYGGGGGGGGSAATTGNGGNGAQGAIIITYTVVEPLTTAYWVGGSGTWTSTSYANWAATSGGTGGAGYADANTNVIFDTYSDSGTVTINGGVCNNLTIQDLVSTITLAPTTSGLSVYGNLTISSTNATISGTAAITFRATSSKTITTGGETLDCPITFDGVGGTWALQDNMTVGTSRTTTLTNGTLNLNGKTLSTGIFSSSNSNTRTLTSSTAATLRTTTTTASSIVVVDISTTTNLTGSNNITIELACPGGTRAFGIGTLTDANSFNVTVNSAGPLYSFATGTHVKNLTLLNNAYTFSMAGMTIYGNLDIQGTSVTISSGNTLFFKGTSGSKTIKTSTIELGCDIEFNGAGSTWTLQDFLVTQNTSTVTLTAGTLDLNGNPIQTGIFNSNNSNIRALISSTPATIFVRTNSSATVWDTATTTNLTGSNNITVSVGATVATTNTKTINAGGLSATNAFNFSIGSEGSTIVFGSVSTVNNLVIGSFTQTISNVALTIYGNLTVYASKCAAGSNAWTLAATSGTKTINVPDSHLSSLDFPIVFDGTGGTWQLLTNMPVGATRTTALQRGTLDLNNKTLSTGIFSSGNSNTRAIQFGTTGKITATGNSATAIDFDTATNLTTTGTVILEVTNATASGLNLGGTAAGYWTEANSLNLTIGSAGAAAGIYVTNTATVTLAGVGYKDVTLTGLTGTLANSTRTIYGSITLATGMTLAAGTNTTTFAATSGTKTITSNGKTMDFPVTFNGAGGTWQLADNMTVGATRTTTLTAGTLNINGKTLSTGLFSSSNSNTRTLAFGVGGITLTAATAVTMWDTGTVTGLTITGTPLVTSTGGGAVTKTINSGQLAEASSISFTLSDTAGTVAFTASNTVRNLTITNNAFTVSNIAITIYGNLSVGGTTVTLTAGTNAWTFASTSGTDTITTNGRTLDFPVTFNGAGGTWQLVDNLTVGSTRTTTLTNGTINLNGQVLNAGVSFTTAAGTKNLTFNGGTLTCPAATTTAFNNAAPTNFTTTAGTGTGKISMTAATAKTFVGGGSTYNCTLENAGAGALTISGSNTFTTISNSVQPTTFTFTAGTTQTVTNFSVSGTAGNLVTINSTTAGTRATLSKASGSVSVLYCSIKDSSATGGATWRALTADGNVDAGNTLGWIFVAAAQGQLLLIFL